MQLNISLPVLHTSLENPAIPLHKNLLKRSTHDAPLAHVWLAHSSIFIKKHNLMVNKFKSFLYFQLYSILSALTRLSVFVSKSPQTATNVYLYHKVYRRLRAKSQKKKRKILATKNQSYQFHSVHQYTQVCNCTRNRWYHPHTSHHQHRSGQRSHRYLSK